MEETKPDQAGPYGATWDFWPLSWEELKEVRRKAHLLLGDQQLPSPWSNGLSGKDITQITLCSVGLS
jgi:hypothetical protein